MRTALIVCTTAFLLAGAAFGLAHGGPIDAAYREAVSLIPRSFLFLARWHWYEILGLLLPLLLLAIVLRRAGNQTPIGTLCFTSILLGTTALLIAACFVPPADRTSSSPSRSCAAFTSSTALVSSFAAVFLPHSHAAPARGSTSSCRPSSVCLLAGMFLVERGEWSGGRRLELPGLAPANPYVHAFLWIRIHTPRDAVFAFNPRLVYLPGEDEQGFRALSGRDQLADDKDAGVVAVIPTLAPRWAVQRNPEFSIDQMSDTERLARLTPLGATWILLPPTAPTALPCPYRNAAVQVCRLKP